MSFKSSKRNILILVKTLLDERSRNQFELAEAKYEGGV